MQKRGVYSCQQNDLLLQDHWKHDEYFEKIKHILRNIKHATLLHYFEFTCSASMTIEKINFALGTVFFETIRAMIDHYFQVIMNIKVDMFMN